MNFARRVFRIAAIYGILALAPQYFLEENVGRDFPPPITHPEHFYGFVGVALAWQFLFLVIANNPVRFRPAMPVAVVEKLAFGVAEHGKEHRCGPQLAVHPTSARSRSSIVSRRRTTRAEPSFTSTAAGRGTPL